MKKQKYHFIGISGAGMSALAGIMQGFGFEVSGSDLKTTGHKKENINGADVVVYSPAITTSSVGFVELKAAKAAKIKTLRYDELLGELTKDSILIAITGMHGKSTTTAMVARIFEEAGLDPTVLVGAKLADWKGKNFRVGKDDLWILEADDYAKKFLTLNPTITITTNIDLEHVDTYKNVDEAIETFAQLFKQTKQHIVANLDNENLRKAVELAKVEDKVTWYGSGASEFNFDILPLLKIIGKHNKSNALAAMLGASEFGIDRMIGERALSSFQGIARRQEFIGEKDEVLVFDDYAHHPTEIKATLQAFRAEYPNRRLVAVFQPHQHKRTSVLFDDFTVSFSDADLVIVSDVFGVAGREGKIFVDSKDLTEAIAGQGAKAVYGGNLNSVKEKLNDIIKVGDLLITLGAGDVTSLGRQWIKE